MKLVTCKKNYHYCFWYQIELCVLYVQKSFYRVCLWYDSISSAVVRAQFHAGISTWIGFKALLIGDCRGVIDSIHPWNLSVCCNNPSDVRHWYAFQRGYFSGPNINFLFWLHVLSWSCPEEEVIWQKLAFTPLLLFYITDLSVRPLDRFIVGQQTKCIHYRNCTHLTGKEILLA